MPDLVHSSICLPLEDMVNEAWWVNKPLIVERVMTWGEGGVVFVLFATVQEPGETVGRAQQIAGP